MSAADDQSASPEGALTSEQQRERDSRALRVAQELFQYVYGSTADRASLGSGSHILMAIYGLETQRPPSAVMARARAVTMAAPAGGAEGGDSASFSRPSSLPARPISAVAPRVPTPGPDGRPRRD